jgi:Ni,Fe-hydrogenase I large subunit
MRSTNIAIDVITKIEGSADYFSRNLHRGGDALRMNAESIIRAYDPCMSCATNFLKIDWIRE